MKKLSATIGFIVCYLLPSQLKAQCTFISPTVDINSTAVQSGNCVVNFNLSFDIITNSGNKIIYLHLWPSAVYPNHDYSCNQCQPTYSVNDNHGKKDLASTVLNIAIDNFGSSPAFLTSYGPDPTAPVSTTSNTPGMSIVKVASATPGAERFIISNVTAVVPGACNNAIVFTGDAWSSNSNSSNASVQCAMKGFSVGLNDPVVTGVCANSSPGQYSFNISTISATRQVYYDVYLDNGNNVFDPGSDAVINSVSQANAITITPSASFSSGLINYPTQLAATTKKIYVAVATVGTNYLISTEITPCSSSGTLPIRLSDFTATRSSAGSVSLLWHTATEEGVKDIVIERKTDGDFYPVKTLAAKNTPAGSTYTYTDKNDFKGLSQYRLKFLGIDNAIQYSNIQAVKGYASSIDISVFPNPARGSGKVYFTNIGDLTAVRLIDISGRTIKNSLIKNNSIELGGLQSGIYVLKLSNGITGEQKVLKLNVTD